MCGDTKNLHLENVPITTEGPVYLAGGTFELEDRVIHLLEGGPQLSTRTAVALELVPVTQVLEIKRIIETIYLFVILFQLMMTESKSFGYNILSCILKRQSQ